METKTIKCPKTNTEVELKSWITGGEAEEIEAPIKDIRFKMNMKGEGESEMNMGEAVRKSVYKAVEIVVKKVGSETEGLLEKLKALPRVDYDFVLGEVDKIVKGEDFEKPISGKKGGTD